MKKLNKIKSSFLTRQVSLAKLALKTGKSMYKNKDLDLKTQLKNTLEKNALDIVGELDALKGSFMKAGQMLSLLGGSFLPKEVHDLFKTLENKTSFLQWDQISKQIPKEWLEKIEIEQVPLAAASLGQVHRVTFEKEHYVMKIQYKNVGKAIKNDIRALKFFLGTLNLIPKDLDLNEIYKEIETMLRREIDYTQEAQSTEVFQKYLSDFDSFKVPLVNHQLSNETIITTEFINGHSLHELESLGLDQETRNKLGREFMKLLFLELFVFEEIQTDSHFGNYLIITDPVPMWGLIDFGAVKAPPQDFIQSYRKLMISLSKSDRDGFIETLFDMKYLARNKENDLDFFWDYAKVIGAPFYEEEYDWGASNISNQMYEYIPKIVKSVSIGNPPAHSFFIDKKIAGVYFILQKLKAKFNVRLLLEEVLQYK